VLTVVGDSCEAMMMVDDAAVIVVVCWLLSANEYRSHTNV